MLDFRVVERKFSEKEDCPTFLLANIHSTTVEENLKKMEEIVEIAHQKGVNVLIFPELTVTGYVWNSTSGEEVVDMLREGENKRIEPRINKIRNSLAESGRGLEYVFYGNVRLKEGEFYNSTFVLNADMDYREEQYIYDKVFLPPVEQYYFRQGSDKRLSIDTKWGRFGFLICYDLCFIELARRYAFVDEVDAIITMSAWHSEAVRDYSHMNIRTDHYYGYIWDLMNASKAAYNQVWSLGTNWVGIHPYSGEYFWGGSGIWAPSGMKLLQGSNIKEELLIIRNVDIKGQRSREQDDFNYRIDFEHFYRQMTHPAECTQYLP